MQGAPLVEVGDEVNASGALLVSCFPSVGFVSSIVAHFMVCLLYTSDAADE